MDDLSRALAELNFGTSCSSTPLPESGDGLLPLNLLDGQRTAKSGPGAVPASRSPRLAKAKAKKTKGISGPISYDLSPSGDLQRSLESRLRARLDVNGSLEYDLTWKHWATESGSPICALRASARRTSVSVYIGWPTADASAMNDGETLETFTAKQSVLKEKHGNGNGAGMPLAVRAQMAGWPKTPQATDGDGGVMEIRPGTTGKYKLRDFAQLAGWATATASKLTQSGDLQNSDGTPWDGTSKPYQNGQPVTTALGDQVKLAGWATAKASDGDKSARTAAGAARELSMRRSIDLPTQAILLTGWPTAAAQNGEKAGMPPETRKGHHIGLQDAARGVIFAWFLVPTGRRVVLAPEFSLWLMGFPEAWVTAAPGAKDWQEAQAALELEYSKALETPLSPNLPPSL